MPNRYFFNREDFRQLWPVFALTGVIVIAIASAGFFFFFHGQRIVEAQLKDKLRSTATAAAIQFDADTLMKIKTDESDMDSAALKDSIRKLQRLREEVTNIKYAYIMRQTDNPDKLMFLADADLALTKDELDKNKNGTVDSDEEASFPGDLYDIEDIPALKAEAFLHPTTDEAVVKDQWGWTISGYAPIHNSAGQTVAVLGIDMDASEFTTLSRSAFSPVVLLLMILAGISIGGSTLLFLWKRRLETMERMDIERSGLMRLAFHQLGGPLTIINWSIEELEEQGQEFLQRTIGNIQEGVKRLTKILKTLKEADLVHSGNIDYRPESASLGAVLRDVARDMKKRLTSRKQKINVEFTDSIKMELDPKLIAGVAQELITNAIDFSPEGSEITVMSGRHGRYAQFEIEDQGCGIPKKDLHRIFNEFTRGSNATRYKADGNGLGLYIVRGIVERAGGRVIAESREGVGTKIIVRLPMA